MSNLVQEGFSFASALKKDKDEEKLLHEINGEEDRRVFSNRHRAPAEKNIVNDWERISVASESLYKGSAASDREDVAILKNLLTKLASYLEREMPFLLSAGDDGGAGGRHLMSRLVRKIMISTGFFSPECSGAGGIAILDFINYHRLRMDSASRSAAVQRFVRHYEEEVAAEVQRELGGPAGVEAAARMLKQEEEKEGRRGGGAEDKFGQVLQELHAREEESAGLRQRLQAKEEEVAGLWMQLQILEESLREAKRTAEAELAKRRELEALVVVTHDNVDSGRNSSLGYEEELLSVSSNSPSPRGKEIGTTTYYVKIRSESSPEEFQFRVGGRGDVSAEAVAAIFPGVRALTYQLDGTVKVLSVEGGGDGDGGVFKKPEEGWLDTLVYQAVTPRPNNVVTAPGDALQQQMNQMFSPHLMAALQQQMQLRMQQPQQQFSPF